MNQNAQKLRQALQQQSYLMMPGIYDCLSAKMAENAGFQAAFFSGGAFSMATLGKPDIGFFNLTEAVHTLRRIVDSVNIPILSDGDNGFGNAIHAADTARAFETIGVAGIQVDDQVLPQSIPCTSKECNEWRYVEPKLIAIRKAVSPEFVILFRTIANITDDLDKAIWRINRAAELGADVQAAKRAGLLHDIGKALDHEFEGTHVALGVEYARKYREKEDIIHAIQAHHGDVECRTLVACLVQAADAISAARPGARRENLENYIKRLEKLEEITGSYPGVEKSYAIQAGREVRVMVKPEQVSEDQMVILARELAKRIENELEYPGQIKVHVLRETKVVEYAK